MELVDAIDFFASIPAWLLVIAIAWSMIWMALAMWKSARKKHLVWFIIFLIIHTLGILEILYLFVFSEMGKSKVRAKKRR